MADQHRVAIAGDADIVKARQLGREVAANMGFSSTDLALIATAISELARNIVQYAKRGEIRLSAAQDGHRRGIEVLAVDDGPGIPNVDQAMQGGFSTSGGLGLGLPGVRRIMDEMSVTSVIGTGTKIKVRKWKP